MGKFAVGDYVSTKKLVDVEKRLIITNNVPVYLGDKMAEYCGRGAVIIAITKNGNYRLDVDGGNYAWHEDWLCRSVNVKIGMPSFKPSVTREDLHRFDTEIRKEMEKKYMDLANEEWKKPFRIRDVKIVVPNKVVEVTFEDRTKEKAVCAEEDTFSLDTAITICIAKHLLGGSSAYNNAVRKANKILVNKEKPLIKPRPMQSRKQSVLLNMQHIKSAKQQRSLSRKSRCAKRHINVLCEN